VRCSSRIASQSLMIIAGMRAAVATLHTSTSDSPTVPPVANLTANVTPHSTSPTIGNHRVVIAVPTAMASITCR